MLLIKIFKSQQQIHMKQPSYTYVKRIASHMLIVSYVANSAYFANIDLSTFLEGVSHFVGVDFSHCPL